MSYTSSTIVESNKQFVKVCIKKNTTEEKQAKQLQNSNVNQLYNLFYRCSLDKF